MRTRAILLAVIIPVSFSSTAFSENPKKDAEKPMPVGGWNAFQSTIQYPDLLRLAGIDGVAIVTASVDETGSISDLHVQTNHDAFAMRVEKAVRKTKWTPGKVNGKPAKLNLVFTIHFMVVGEGIPTRMTVEAPAPKKK